LVQEYQLGVRVQGAHPRVDQHVALHNKEPPMLGIGQTLPAFEVTGVKPGFMNHEENGVSAFETLTEKSFEGKWHGDLLLPEGLQLRVPRRNR